MKCQNGPPLKKKAIRRKDLQRDSRNFSKRRVHLKKQLMNNAEKKEQLTKKKKKKRERDRQRMTTTLKINKLLEK